MVGPGQGTVERRLVLWEDPVSGDGDTAPFWAWEEESETSFLNDRLCAHQSPGST